MNKKTSNQYAESTLHKQLKQIYAEETGGETEVKIDRFYIDVLKDNNIIEIQTASFYQMRTKIKNLSGSYNIKIVYPVYKIKKLVYIDKSGEILSTRKSPKTATIFDLFDELVRFTDMIDKVTIDVLFIDGEEYRRRDGKGSWRRKGTSILDKRLVKIIDRIIINNKYDLLKLISDKVKSPFTNKDLSKALEVPVYKARRVSYTLKKTGLIKSSGKRGREVLYSVNLPRHLQL